MLSMKIELSFEYIPEKKKLKAKATNDLTQESKEIVFGGDLEQNMFNKFTQDYLSAVYQTFIKESE